MSTSDSNILVQPYLFFGGRCEEALEFYGTAIGAKIERLVRFKESPEPQGLPDCFDDKVMHASVRIGKTTFMVSDGQCEGDQNFDGFSLSITVPDIVQAENIFAAERSCCHASREDILGPQIRNAAGSVRRQLDGFGPTQDRHVIRIPSLNPL